MAQQAAFTYYRLSGLTLDHCSRCTEKICGKDAELRHGRKCVHFDAVTSRNVQTAI